MIHVPILTLLMKLMMICYAQGTRTGQIVSAPTSWSSSCRWASESVCYIEPWPALPFYTLPCPALSCVAVLCRDSQRLYVAQEDTFLVDEQLAAAEAVTFPEILAHLRRLPSSSSFSSFSSSSSSATLCPPDEDNSRQHSAPASSDNSCLIDKMYVHGHMAPDCARALFAQVLPTELAGSDAVPSREHSRATPLAEAEMNFMFPSFNPDDQNSAIVSHFQVRSRSLNNERC